MAADPVKQLQAAARQVAGRFVPGAVAGAVEIKDAQGRVLFSVAVPAGGEVAEEERDDSPTVEAGWGVDDRRATFDGKPVPVAASRLRLLRELVAADGPLQAKDLIGRAFDRNTSENNVRYHVAELRRELKDAFRYPDDPIEATGDGYRLVLR